MAQISQAASNSFRQTARTLRHKKSKLGSKVDIVSPLLCDDALKRLTPSLQAYKGCTVIDINPGLGLWSSKIHEIIQPRKHYLAESPKSHFLPHLASFASQENGRYQLLTWEDKYCWRPDRYVAEGLLPPFEASKSQEPNKSILVIANSAVSQPTSRSRGTGSKSHLALLDWVHDIRRRIGFHAGGGVRMLLWCPAKDTTAIIPRTIVSRSKISLSLEMTCHVEPIVGSDESARGKQKRRDQSVELTSAKRVLKRMRDSGITLPAGRESELYKQVQEESKRADEGNTGTQAPSATVRARGWHKELQELQHRFAAGGFAKADGMRPGDQSKLPRGAERARTSQYARMVELENNLKHIQKRTNAAEQLLQEQAGIDALDTRANSLPPNDPQKQAVLQEMQERKKKLRERLEMTRNPHIREEFVYFKHDRKASSQVPPLLMWDQRRAEPMKAYDEEFFPEQSLSLLDIEPKQPLLFPLAEGDGNFSTTLLSTLFQNGKNNLTALETLAPGAFDALIPKVPALTDPGRGGERDVRDLPISRLTPEMAHGLTKAWIEWPFKPDLIDI
ncbi:MAG: hypothetical protein Q9185_002232 [Variospora sp. 1 TL-2023]